MIGLEIPKGKTVHGVYKGRDIRFIGEGALVCIKNSNEVVVQFDHSRTGKYLGWWLFPKEDWDLRKSNF